MRASRPCCLLGVLGVLGMLSCSSAARAQDWLVTEAACTPSASAEPAGLALSYPSEALPAVVERGKKLLVRVRLPAALTPPPGVQQPQALAGFGAELSTRAPALPPDTGEVTLKQVLQVLDLRPDGPMSLVYRLTLAVPAFLPEGSYALSLQTPFGPVRSNKNVLRVLAPGARPRLAWLSEGASLAELSRAALPVDVMLVARAQPHDEAAVETAQAAEASTDHPQAAPRLRVDRGMLALRLGTNELLVAGSCAQTPPGFADAVRSTLAREARTEVLLESTPSLASTHYLPLAARTALPLPSAADLVLTRAGGTLLLTRVTHGPGATSPSELLLGARDATHAYAIAPPSSTVAPSSNTRVLFHAFEPFTPSRTMLAARVRQRDGQLAIHARRARPSGRLRIASEPEKPRSGQAFTVSLLGASGEARASFAFDEGEPTALEGTRARARLWRLGRQRVQAFSIGPDGTLERQSGWTTVASDRPGGCAVGARSRTTATFGAAALWVSTGWILRLAMLKRPRRRPEGNTLGRLLR